MRVAIVSPYNPRPSVEATQAAVVGGVERALDSLAEALQREGADVTLWCTSDVAGADVRESGVRVARVKRRGVLFRAPLSTIALRASKGADVVHVPATYPTVSELAPLVSRARGVPCVVDYHFDPHGTSRGMRRAASIYGATLARGMRAASWFFVKSDEYRACSAFASRLPRERTSVLPNGVDAARFDVSPARGGTVLVVGRLVPYKGVANAIRAMAGVQLDFDAPLVIAGDGPLRAELEGLARDLRVDARFLGYVPDEALPGLYASSRLTLLPSANAQEAFGITLIESMAAGTPVVASDLPGVREVASLGGVTVPPNDFHALERAIRAALKGELALPEPDELKRRVRERFDWGSIARSALRTYERLANGRRA